MGLYKRPDSPVWWMSFTVNGKAYRRSAETEDRKLAVKIFAKVQTQIAEGKWFEIEARQRTFDEMMERFMIEHSPAKELNMQKSYKNSLAHLKGFFSGMTLNQIGPDAVLRYISYRRNQNNSKPGTRNRELAMLSKAFSLAKLWKWTRDNPCQLVQREKEDNEIGRCLTFEEEEKLLTAAKAYLNGQLEEIIILALNTGMREGEILKLRWEQIDFAQQIINTINEKTNRPKTVSMNETVCSLLKEKSKIISMSGYVFTTANDTPFIARNLIRAWDKALEKAGIAGRLRFHDLRHTVGTRLIRAGRDIYAVAAVLDHSQLSTAKRYAKHNSESMRNVVRLLEKKTNFHDFITLDDEEEKRVNVSP